MKLRLAVLAATLVLAVPVIAQVQLHGAPCVKGTLAQYIALGRLGCTAEGGDFTFFNFTYAANNTGIPASAILVTPSMAQTFFTLTFSAAWKAAPGAVLNAAINYNLQTTWIGPVPEYIIEGPSINLELGAPKVNGIIGSVAVTESAPIPPPPSPVPAPITPLRVYETCADACSEQLVATGPKLPTYISDAIALSGGTGGVSFSSFSAGYRITCPSCLVPR